MDQAVLRLELPENCAGQTQLVADWRQDNDPCLDYYNTVNGLLQRGLEEAVLNVTASDGYDSPEQLVKYWQEDDPPPEGTGEITCCPAVPVDCCPASSMDSCQNRG
jgi:hypothetical protein